MKNKKILKIIGLIGSSILIMISPLVFLGIVKIGGWLAFQLENGQYAISSNSAQGIWLIWGMLMVMAYVLLVIILLGCCFIEWSD